MQTKNQTGLKNFKPKINFNHNTYICVFLFFVFLLCAHRCGPCKQIAPTFSKLSTKYPAAVFLKVDVNKCEVSCDLTTCMYVPVKMFQTILILISLCFRL